MTRLQNKTALITGGTSGIGLATALRFAAEGARVIVTGTDAGRVDEARRLDPNIVAIHADAGDVAGQQALAAEVAGRFDELDVLFVNAGIADFRPLAQWDEAAFDRSIAINLRGPFFLVQALLSMFANPASIILNTSINARIGMPNSSVYALTKAGLRSLARTLSGELVGRGIRVNAVSPGPVETPLYGKISMSAADIAALINQVPLARLGHVEEIAAAVAFLASDEGAFTVGSEFVVDGGMSNL